MWHNTQQSGWGDEEMIVQHTLCIFDNKYTDRICQISPGMKVPFLLGIQLFNKASTKRKKLFPSIWQMTYEKQNRFFSLFWGRMLLFFAFVSVLVSLNQLYDFSCVVFFYVMSFQCSIISIFPTETFQGEAMSEPLSSCSTC